jgi:hypothetical protein
MEDASSLIKTQLRITSGTCANLDAASGEFPPLVPEHVGGSCAKGDAAGNPLEFTGPTISGQTGGPHLELAGPYGGLLEEALIPCNVVAISLSDASLERAFSGWTVISPTIWAIIASVRPDRFM